jgi:cytoskeletal protein RodZ
MQRRVVARARLIGLLALEAAALPLLAGGGDGAPAAIDWAHLARWASDTAPEDAVVAVVRLLGMGLAAWLLATTLLYFLAQLTRVPSLVRGVSWATIPAVRRIVDAAVAASVFGGAVLGPHPAGAQIVAPPPIVVELNSTTTSAPAHRYVPVPAGDRSDLVPTTTRAAPATTSSPTATSPAATATTVLPAPAVPAAPVRQPADHVHTVVAGDNLWTIASAELSRQTGRTADDLAEAEVRDYWLQLIDANRSRLLSGNPSLIYPGESIFCPPATK